MNRFVLEDEDIIILGEKETQNDTSNNVGSNSVSGGVDNDFNNGQTTEVVNGGSGSGNFGHSGRPGLVGGSGGGVGKFLFDGDLPSKNPQPTKEGYVVVHHNTDNETADAIAKEGLIAGKNLGAYQVSPEEGLGIWTDSRAKTDSSYGGCTISFQIPKEEYEKYAVNDTQHLIPRNIAREDIVCIDKIINENGSNGKPIKVSNLKDNVDYYTKKGLDENKVISIIAKNSHGVITEQEIKELVDFKKKVANGGPGSGNFGHSGRPGEVGGSAPRGSIAQPASRTVTAKWLSEHREFLKSQGYTDKWIDEQLEYLEQQKLKDRAIKAKTLEEFDEVMKEMEANPHDFSVWKKNVGDPTRASLERKLELKSKVQNPEQQKAVDDLKATGIELPKASEKWLRENCPQELVESITSSMKQAEKDGLDLSEVRLKMTETTTRGGSCTVDLDGTIKMFLNKNDYFDLERTASRNSKNGPDGSRWWTNGKLDSCASHELGHALTWQVLKNQGMSPYRFKALCKEIVSLANDRFARESGEDYWTSRGKLSSNNNNEYMSRYGGKNSGEVIAESHSNPSYSRYTQIVNEILIQSVKGEIKWT